MELGRRRLLKLGAFATVVALAACTTATGPAPKVSMPAGKVEVQWFGQSATGPAGLIQTMSISDGSPPARRCDSVKAAKSLRSGRHHDHPGAGRASSEVTVTDPATKKSTTHPGGEPCGFIIELENGMRLYHMGDTGLFGDLRLIGRYYRPDIIMIPIGGHKYAIPFHYATNPFLKGTPQAYAIIHHAGDRFPCAPASSAAPRQARGMAASPGGCVEARAE